MDKRILLPLAILPAFQAENIQAADQLVKRPNIILFMVDDMGWEDTSLPFWKEKTHYNEVYETPNMERLARQGVMFTQQYQFSVPLQPDHRDECCPPPCHQLDTPERQDNRPQRQPARHTGLEL